MIENTLVSLAQEAMILEQHLLESQGELTPEIEQWLLQVEHNLGVKVDHYKFTLDRFQATAKLLKEKAEEFTKAARTLENVSERLKARIKEVMLMTNRSEIVGKNYRFKLSPSAPKMVIHDHDLPVKYKRQVITTEIDKELIKQEIKAGEVIPGVQIEPVYALRTSVTKE